MASLAPRPYQIEARDFLAQRRTALYVADPGLGKSCAALLAADRVQARRVLVVSPPSALVSWPKEAAKWAPGRPVMVIRQPADVPLHGPALAAVSYNRLLPRHDHGLLHAALTAAEPWDVLILDEAHYLKDTGAGRTRAVYGEGARAEDDAALVRNAARTWALTGTPAPNNYSEVYTHLRALSPGSLRDDAGRALSFHAFRAKVCKLRQTPFGVVVEGSRNGRWLKQRLHDFMLRHRKADVANDLPPMDWVSVPLDVNVPNTPAVRAADKAMRQDWAHMDDDLLLHTLRSSNAVATLRRTLGGAKAGPAGDWIADQLDAGMPKVIVFAVHQDVLNILHRYLRGYGVVRIDGSTPQSKRAQAVDAFQNDPGTRVFLGQIHAAGTALTLTAASDVVMVEMDWTPANNVQAAQRAHRLGQKNHVLVRVMHAPGTLDERVSEILRRKSADIAAVFD